MQELHDLVRNEPMNTDIGRHKPNENKPLKHRLRPRKPKPAEPEVVILDVRPTGKSRKLLTKPGPKPAMADKNTARKVKQKTSGRPLRTTLQNDGALVGANARKGSSARTPIEILDEDGS